MRDPLCSRVIVPEGVSIRRCRTSEWKLGVMEKVGVSLEKLNLRQEGVGEIGKYQKETESEPQTRGRTKKTSTRLREREGGGDEVGDAGAGKN